MHPRVVLVLLLLVTAGLSVGYATRQAEGKGPGDTHPVPPPEACYATPHDKLCSSMPHDILETFLQGYSGLAANTQRPFDNFSWQLFVALNWPADKDGNPSPKPIGSDPTAPRVWEFYPTPAELFPQPLPAENRAPAALVQAASGKKPRRLYTWFSTRSNPPNLKPDSLSVVRPDPSHGQRRGRNGEEAS
jgi:hypothetical protein